MGEHTPSRGLRDVVSLLSRPTLRQHPNQGERSLSREATPVALLLVRVGVCRPLRCRVNLRAARGKAARISHRLFPTSRVSGRRRRTSSPVQMGLRLLQASDRHHQERVRRLGIHPRRSGRQLKKVVSKPDDSARSTIYLLPPREERSIARASFTKRGDRRPRPAPRDSRRRWRGPAVPARAHLISHGQE